MRNSVFRLLGSELCSSGVETNVATISLPAKSHADDRLPSPVLLNVVKCSDTVADEDETVPAKIEGNVNTTSVSTSTSGSTTTDVTGHSVARQVFYGCFGD